MLRPYLLCQVLVLPCTHPCARPLAKMPLSFSPEFMEHCQCFLHPRFQVLLELLEIQDSSLTTSYLNVNGIHRKQITNRKSAFVFGS